MLSNLTYKSNLRIYLVNLTWISWIAWCLLELSMKTNLSWNQNLLKLVLDMLDYWHHQNLLEALLLQQSPLPSRDKWVRWHAETIMVIHFCYFQDYCSLLFLLETTESVGMWRQSWSSIFVVFKTTTIFSAFQRQASALACGDNHGLPLSLFSRLLQSPLPSRDKQVRWNAKTIMVIHFCCFQDY